MSAKEKLDEVLDQGKRPSFMHIKLEDVPSFRGELTMPAGIYLETAAWPMVILGAYRGVAIVVNVKAI